MLDLYGSHSFHVVTDKHVRSEAHNKNEITIKVINQEIAKKNTNDFSATCHRCLKWTVKSEITIVLRAKPHATENKLARVFSFAQNNK